jgi:hypothetical protein
MPEFSEKERCIFHFWDGSQERYVDPVVIMLNIQNEQRDESIEQLFENLKIDSLAVESFVKLMKLATRVFGITPLTSEGVGLTTLECLKVVADFMSQAANIKKNIESIVSGLPASVESDELITNVGTAFGSTDPESTPSDPPKSPSELKTP